jgi:signal peptidase I
MGAIKFVIDFIMDILETIVFVGSIFIVFYLFIIQPHQVKGASMEHTFESGDYILTSKITYRFTEPKQGEVIVFKSPRNPDIDYIKRIIALGGDRVMIKDTNVYVNDILLNEKYIADKTYIFEGAYIQEGIELTIPEGYIFVMGDNRPRSSDSREFGPIPVTDIIGKVLFRYYPANKTGWIKNPYQSIIPSLLTVIPYA